ncbi:MAG TPA: DUF488 domain-containing protein [Solirubrobacteraceae bacterium]|nr:DUF488 domain-containing protein [Solirubrobacteraceae bacterium]
MTLWTIGYETLWPDALVAELEAAGVQRVLDVRLRPQSRRPGMSKTKLALKLAEHGIAYEHRRELGTPLEIRGLFRAGHLEQAAAAYRAYAVASAGDELDTLAAELPRVRTALLCLEANPAGCHRRVVAELLRERVPDLEVEDL